MIEGKGVFCNEKNPFAYDALGENYFDMERDPYIHNGTAVLFDDGDQVTVAAQDEPVRFLLISGKPIGEPVAWYGPIVMNTEEELQSGLRGVPGRYVHQVGQQQILRDDQEHYLSQILQM